LLKYRRKIVLFEKISVSLFIFSLFGCHTDMWVQPKVKAQHESEVFPHGQGSRDLPKGVVSKEHLKDDDAYYKGRIDGKLVDVFPFKITDKMMRNGLVLYNDFCSHCHGATGNGNGMIAQRGLNLTRNPRNLHEKRLLDAPVGHFFDVISNGSGVMFPLASSLNTEERWQIVAYIKALQASQDGRLSDVPQMHLKDLYAVPNSTAANKGIESK